MDAADAFVHAATRSFATGTPCPPPPAGEEWVTRAVAAGVLAPVTWVAQHAGHPVPPALRRLRALTAARDMQTAADLALLGETLDGIGAGWAVLKGVVLRNVVFEQRQVRDAADLDVLVDPSRVAEAVAALRAAGASVPPADWAHARRHRTAELTLRLPHGTVLDLHWSLVNQAPLRDRADVRTSELLARRRTVVVDAVPVRTLDEVDFALHVILHACLSGCSELRWLLDVQQVLRSASFDQQQLYRRAVEWDVVPHARVAIEAAATYVDPHVGEWAAAMGPRTAWVRLLGRLVRRRPPSAPSVSSHSVRNWYRATRDTRLATAGAVAVMVVHGVRYRAGTGEPALHPTSDDAGLDQWLAAAEAEAGTAAAHSR